MGSELPEQGSPRRSARPPGGKAVGIVMTPGPGRMAALAIVGVPLVLLMIVGLKTADWGGGPLSLLFQVFGLEGSPQNSGQGPNGFLPSPEPTATAGDPGPAAYSGASSTPGPGETVRKAYRAVNRHDYKLAYRLGLATSGQSYAKFVAGYRGITKVTLTEVSVQGDDVNVFGTETEQDGFPSFFSESYTVTGGRIASAQTEQGF
jgi:hypothetical protein